MKPPGADVVLLATADWDNPFWTNKQHVAVELARRGFRVLYVDSLGLRRPTTGRADRRRIAGRFRKAAAGVRPAGENLWVWSPIAVPFMGRGWARRLNRAWLGAGLGREMRRLGLRPDILWTYNPMTAALLDLDALGFATVVYHCVDEIQAQPGMPAPAIAAAERELTARSTIVFTTTPKLLETRRAWNPNTHCLPNAADFDHFARARDSAATVPADLAALRPPRIGFIGAISAYKVDFDLVRSIAAARPDWSVVLIGQVGEGDPWTDARALEGLPNLHLFGPRPYAELPRYLKGIDVAILPSALNVYTEAMFPLKFFEYLAAGCPVVSADLAALRPFAAVVRIAASPADFVAGIEEALRGRAAPLEARLALARAHTYRTRMDRMLEFLGAPR